MFGSPLLRHSDGEWGVSVVLDGVEFVTEVTHQSGSNGDVNSSGGQTPADLRGTLGVASSEPVHVQGGVHCQHLLSLQLSQVLHGQLKHIGLLQLADALSLGLQGEHHQVLQLVQAVVDPGSPLPLDERLHNFSVLVSLRHGLVSEGLYLDSRRHGSVVFAVNVRTRLTDPGPRPVFIPSVTLPGLARRSTGRQLVISRRAPRPVSEQSSAWERISFEQVENCCPAVRGEEPLSCLILIMSGRVLSRSWQVSSPPGHPACVNMSRLGHDMRSL